MPAADEHPAPPKVPDSSRDQLILPSAFTSKSDRRFYLLLPFPIPTNPDVLKGLPNAIPESNLSTKLPKAVPHADILVKLLETGCASDAIGSSPNLQALPEPLQEVALYSHFAKRLLEWSEDPDSSDNPLSEKNDGEVQKLANMLSVQLDRIEENATKGDGATLTAAEYLRIPNTGPLLTHDKGYEDSLEKLILEKVVYPDRDPGFLTDERYSHGEVVLNPWIRKDKKGRLLVWNRAQTLERLKFLYMTNSIEGSERSRLVGALHRAHKGKPENAESEGAE